MGRYASKTKVPVSRSKAEIEKILERYGAGGFMSGWQGDKEALGFVVGSTRFQVSITREEDEQKHRQQWRAMGLVIKAKLEAVESEISTLEHEFMAWVVTPSGQTLGEVLVPQLEAISHGEPPKLLTAG